MPVKQDLMSVSALGVEHGANEDQVIAALLPDAAEDQGGAATLDKIRTTFGRSDPLRLPGSRRRFLGSVQWRR
jgi:(p)ppGpp synthase/HD superfamily hydrolase